MVMKAHTSRFGEIEVEDSEIVTLPEGIIGFPELKKYALLDHEENSPFKWLQSLEDGAVAFVLVNPMTFHPDFTVEVTEEEIKSLQLNTLDDAVITVIVTIPSNPKDMTANLKAPLIFNLKNRLGKQVILRDNKYRTRHSVLKELQLHTKGIDNNFSIPQQSPNTTGEQSSKTP